MNITNDSKMNRLNPTTGSNTLVTSMEKSKLQDSSKFGGVNEDLLQNDENMEEEDAFVGGYMTCCGSFRFFIKNACIDIGRHKC